MNTTTISLHAMTRYDADGGWIDTGIRLVVDHSVYDEMVAKHLPKHADTIGDCEAGLKDGLRRALDFGEGHGHFEVRWAPIQTEWNHE